VEGHSSAAPILHVYDRSGIELQHVVVQVPESQSITIVNGGFTRSTDGYLAVAGIARAANSLGANFLALILPDGTRQTLVRTDSYLARAVVFSSDGMIWTAGEKPESLDYPIIQRFDRNGNVLGGALWRTRFPRNSQLFTGLSYLVASKDRVGWFSTGAGQYFEFSLDGKEMVNYKHTLANTVGLALCDDNSVWISAETRDKTGNAQSTLYSLDRVHGTWLSGKAQLFSYLYGCSGTTLATSSGNDIAWIEPR
jgi:hypothetical protein